MENKYCFTKADRKYRYLTKDDLKEGLECYKWTIGEYDTNVDFFGPNRQENSDNYHLSRDVEWVPHILTIQDIFRIYLFNGDLRNSPGIPLYFFALKIDL